MWLPYLPTLPDTTTNLPVSCTGHQISRIKSSYELFCALIWNVSHFLPKFEFSLIQRWVSGAFSVVFHHWLRLFRHYNHKSYLWWSVPLVTLHIMSPEADRWLDRILLIGWVVNRWHSKGEGVLQKKESPDFRIPEVCISGLCTTTNANNLDHCCSSLNNKYFSQITSIYLFFSLQHYLLPFQPLTNNDTLYK